MSYKIADFYGVRLSYFDDLFITPLISRFSWISSLCRNKQLVGNHLVADGLESPEQHVIPTHLKYSHQFVKLFH